MKNQYLKKWRLLSVLFLLMCLSPHMLVRAQSIANYAFSTSTTGTLDDLSSGSTSLLTGNNDDAATTVNSIGFNFTFMGATYGFFSANSNGQFQFHTTSGATAIGTNVAPSAGVPNLFPMTGDNEVNNGMRYKVTGTAPNRKFVLEWNQFYAYFTNLTNAGNMQLWLDEATGKIDFVYGEIYNSSGSSITRSIGIATGTTATTQGSVSVAASPTYSASATLTSNTFAAGSGTATGSPLIANLGSSAQGSRRVYTFTPPVSPAAPTSLSFSGVGAFGMTLNWVDNATNETGYQIYRSLDGVTYTLITTTAANATSYLATSLTNATLYYWKVLAVNEGAVSTPDLLGSQMTLSSGTISGIKTVGSGGDYNNLTTAFNAINVQGLAGDVELQLITGYPAAPETYPIQSSNTVAVGIFNVKVYPTVSGLSITSANTTGTLNLNNAKNLTFDGRVNQTGSNDLVIANTNAGTSYAILFNNDAQNNAIKNAIVQSVNTSTSSGTIVFGTTTGTNGNDNNTIDNCDIRDGATTPFNGIYSVGSTGTAAQFNDNNTISNNRISNFFSAGSSTVGVYVGSGNSTWTITNNKLFQTATRTYTTGNTHNGIQVSNTNGNGFVITGNTIGYASAAGTGVYTIAGAVTNRFIGINVSAGTTTASSVQGNTISGFNLTTSSGAATSNGVFAGIHITNGNVNVGNTTPNVIGGTTGTGAIAVTSSTTGSLVVGINSSSSGTVNISNNLIGSITASGSSATVSAGITGIQVSAGTPTINGNTIGSTTTANSISSPTVSTSGTGQFIRGIDVTSGVTSATSIQSNTIANMSQAATGSASNARGISYAGTGLATISLNTVYNMATAGSGQLSIIGILHAGAATGGAIVNKNTVYTLSNTNTGANQVNVIGIGYAGPTAGSVTNNIVYDLQNASTMTTATTPPVASGILLQSVTTSATVSNNMISVGNAQTTNTEFIGIWNNSTSTGTLNIYNNSISISGTASSGALPTYGIIRGNNTTTAITSPMDIRNNIISNTRGGGTGKHYAIANQSSPVSTTGWGLNASNYNLLNTSNTATVGLWGATDETFNAWRVAANSDANSYSAIPVTFVDITTGNLHLNMGVTATPIESGGTPIASVTTDIDGQNRPGPSGSVNGGATSPDLGADEFDGVPALPVITLNSVTPPASTQCTATARVVSVNVTTPVGTITAVNLAYTVNGVAQTPITMTNTTGTTWTGTIPVPTPANATIAWGVSATNSSALTGSYVGTPYADEPLTGVTASASASITTVCSGSASNLSASLVKSGSLTIGTAASNSTTFPDIPFNHTYGGSKTQYIFKATELTAAGLSAGNITALSIPITSLGTTPLNSFSISIGHTAQNTSVTNTAIVSGLTQVYSNAAQTMVVGANTYTFSTPFNWNGTSNIVVSIVFSNNNAGGTSHTVTTSNAGFQSSLGIRADNTTGACLLTAVATTDACVSTTNSNSVSSVRPLITFTGNTPPAITSVTWMDGATTVGTGNPLTVNPTTTTTYTANITALGCTATPAPTATVTVNPLPSAPTATNSAQCGTQIPTASVASTSGLPTPTFVWYSASTGGTVMQSSTSTTYTSNVASTTTFYVSELNSTTGCESSRTAVTVTVATADGIQASVDNATICIGSTINLSVVNTNPTPLQNYTYTWTGAAGSGLASQSGTPIAITPTLPGTYTYNVSAVDGGCNAVSSVNVTVNPFTSTVTPINVTCNGYNNGSFSQGAVSCGTAASYSVDGGSFGPIPTNLTPGTHTVVTMNSAGFTSASQTITITQPSTVINTPAGTNIAVCQNSASAMVNATASTNAPGTGSVTVVIPFNVATQPTENSATSVPTVAASPNVIATATMAALPAGAVITSGTLNYNGITALGSSWMSDVRLGLTGAATQAYTGGTGSTNSAGTFNYTATVAPGSISTAGGSISLHYFDFYSDNTGDEATFPTGVGVANLTITYTPPANASISWWNASTGGTQIGTGSPFETVGTSVLPNTTTPGVYTVYAQGEYTGCSGLSRTPITVTVNALPAVNAGSDQTVCLGSSVTLNGSGATSYTWNNGVTNGTPFTATATTTYTVTGTDANGCQNTDAVLVTVNALPTVNAGADQAICTGSSATLNGSGATSYTWNNGVTDGVAFTPSATTTYTVTGTDANGCQNTDAVVVTVNSLPTVSAGADQAICPGSSVTLNGSGAVSYSWDNGVTNGTPFTPSATTTYTVTGTDANGCQNTDAVVVTINTLPTVNAGTDQVVCSGSSVTLNGSGAVSYSWDNGVTDGTPFTATATTTYTVTGTDANGCQNTDAVVVTVNALPTVSAGADQAICSGSSVTLNGSGAVSYSWDNGVTDGVAFVPSATTTYTVTGTDANGCQNTDAVVVTVNSLPTVSAGADQASCSGSSVTLNGSGAVSYSWDNGVTDGVAFVPSATTTYTVTGTDANGCQNTDAVVVTVGTLPTVSAGADQVVCSGSSVTLNGSGAVSYSWDNGVTDATPFTATATTTYTVTGTDANGCQNTDAVVVTVNALPTVSAGADQVVCSGSSVTLNGSGAVSYSWDNGVTDATPFTATATTTYTVTGTDANGCQNTDAAVVTVNALPAVSAGADQSVCAGSSVTLNGSGATSYSWDNGVTNGTPFTPSATATYTVTGTDANGCQNTDAVVVTVNALPVATATDNGNATITASNGNSYQWINCTTGTAIAGATAQTFAPSTNGSYAVVVSNASGCTDTSSCVTINNVGIKESTNVSISVYPNPTHNEVTITMSASSAKVEVVDAQGKLLQTTEVISGGKVDLSAYETGVYFLRIQTENGSTLERIVKN